MEMALTRRQWENHILARCIRLLLLVLEMLRSKPSTLLFPPAVDAPAMDLHKLVKPFIVSISESPEDFGAEFVDVGELPLLQLPKL